MWSTDRTLVRLCAAVLLLLAANVQASPGIQSWTLDNGVRVLFVPAPELPMVDLRLVFDAGSARDGDRPGLASLTNALLAEGAGGESAEAISERFAGLGAEFGRGALRDMAWLSLRSVTDSDLLSPAVETFALVAGRPDFPPSAFERQRSRMLVGLEHKRQRPSALAQDAFYEAVFGNHPYAQPPEGSESSLQALSPEDTRDFHARHYVGSNAVLAMVGALSREQAEALAAEAAGRLSPGEPPSPLPAVQQLQGPVEVSLEHPSSQSHLLLGQPGISRDDPDFFALYLGNHVLGGSGLVSRLHHSIREQRGLSYSVYSYFLPMALSGPFVAGLQTRNDQAEDALKLLRAEVARFVEEGPTAEELAAAKKNISGGFPLRIDSNSKIVEHLAMIGFYRLPVDYLETFVPQVEAVTLEQIRDAFQRRLQPQAMVAVVVGGG